MADPPQGYAELQRLVQTYEAATAAQQGGDLRRAYDLLVQACEQLLALAGALPEGDLRVFAHDLCRRCLDRAEQIKHGLAASLPHAGSPPPLGHRVLSSSASAAYRKPTSVSSGFIRHRSLEVPTRPPSPTHHPASTPSAFVRRTGPLSQSEPLLLRPSASGSPTTRPTSPTSLVARSISPTPLTARPSSPTTKSPPMNFTPPPSSPFGRITPPPLGRVTPPPLGRITPPPLGRVTPPPLGRVTPPPSTVPTSSPQSSCTSPPLLPSSASLPGEDSQYYRKLILQARSVPDILAACQATEKAFEDPLFPANDCSLFGRADSRPTELADLEVMWRRPRDISVAPVTFDQASQECDAPMEDLAGGVVQGALGDCWFLGALSLLATQPEKVRELIMECSPLYGVYMVKFFRNRMWVNVLVDDRIPCSKNGVPVFGRNRNPNEFWVPLIEKAYAKMCGSYLSLQCGRDSDALVDLTAGIAMTLVLRDYEVADEDEHEASKLGADVVWKLLSSYRERKYLMGCARSSKNKTVCQGVVPHHAYGITALPVVAGQRLLRIRNPWGDCYGVWQGDWSRGSACWNKLSATERQQLNYSTADDGTFFIELHDFCQYFDKISLCKSIPSDWKEVTMMSEWQQGSTAGGCTNFSSWVRNPQFHIVVSQPTQAFIVLSQGDYRKFGEAQAYSYTIGLKLLRNGDPKHRRTLTLARENVVANTKFLNARDRTVSVLLEPQGSPYVVVPTTHSPEQTAKFKVSVYSEKPVQLVPILPERGDWEEQTTAGEWGEQTCGGCMNEATWCDNPFALLHVPAGYADVVLRLAPSTPLSATPTCVGLYVFDPTISLSEPVAQTTEFSDYVALPLCLPQLQQPHAYIVVPTTFEPNWRGRFTLTLYHAAGDAANLVAQELPFSHSEAQMCCVIPNK
eukprot:TRINITY_DN621_c0_g1_i1.p1 TRINITY_DN621_c0_g1~~TRINITY_DN621_c0_g1_i1.p1  ORF type:complete len:937 (-),score=139.11 TRINITY_DN621_c0_g1_i1:2285-5026(-)